MLRLEELGVIADGYDVSPHDPREVVDLEGVEGVVDLAAVSRPALAAKNPALAWHTNVTRAVRLCERARSNGAWYLYASSREVYGENYGAKHSNLYDPVGVYARTKVAGEMGVLNAGGGVLRLSNVYGGLGDWPDRVVPAFVTAALRGLPVPLDCTAGCFDFVHVRDAVEAICEAIQCANYGALVVSHVATGKLTSLLRLAHLVGEACGVRLAVEPFERERVAARNADLEKTIKHPVLLEEGLERYVRLVRETAVPFREV